MEINRVTHTASKLWSACGNGTQVAEALRLLVYLRGGAWFGSWRPAGEGAVLLGQLVQAGLQALDAPVQLRHAPLRQLAHLGHLARKQALLAGARHACCCRLTLQQHSILRPWEAAAMRGRCMYERQSLTSV